MTLAEWLIPKPSLAAQAQYRHTCDILRSEGRDNVDRVIDLACSLAQQNMLQQTIIRQATQHIGELELIALLMEAPPRRPTLRQRLARLLGRE
jgi:hypothetical protein